MTRFIQLAENYVHSDKADTLRYSPDTADSYDIDKRYYH